MILCVLCVLCGKGTLVTTEDTKDHGGSQGKPKLQTEYRDLNREYHDSYWDRR